LIYLGIAAAVLALVALVAWRLWSIDRQAEQAAGATSTAQVAQVTNTAATATALAAQATPFGAENDAELISLASGLQYEDLQVGEGTAAQEGDQVTVHYTGWLTDGTEFDSSLDGDPITFSLARGTLIDGWIEGVAGMQPGGVRRLYIPGDLAYGAAGRAPTIPPNATLVFEIELVSVNGQ
jgi:FKBP-type peptidyl-prolyl cis-trans isomerase FkpA